MSFWMYITGSRGQLRSGQRLEGIKNSDIDSINSSIPEPTMPYQVHRKVMGWKLTSVQRRRNLVGMLDLVNSTRQEQQRTGGRKSAPEPQQVGVLKYRCVCHYCNCAGERCLREVEPRAATAALVPFIGENFMLSSFSHFSVVLSLFLRRCLTRYSVRAAASAYVSGKSRLWASSPASWCPCRTRKSSCRTARCCMGSSRARPCSC